MRIDLFLKDKFIEIFNVDNDKILFPSICFKPYHKVVIHPRINDMMVCIPKKYIDFYKQNEVSLCHDTWYSLVQNHNFKYNQLDTMLNTYHDSDSSKDYNPIYYIVNRHQENIHITTEIFDKYNFT